MGTSGSVDDDDLTATAPVAPGDAVVSGGRVGRFVVRGTVGAGGAGTVVAAYDPVLDRQIALKLLHTDETAAGKAWLLQEAQAMARLAHPNVVAVHEAGAADGHVYLAMELVDGGTLRAWLAAAPRTWREVRDRFLEAGRGLAAAHDVGLVHRDFKPDNVLVGRDGRARVTDFGLVRPLPPAPVAGGERTTTVAGTPRYMAPEQHRGQAADHRADQFSFCVSLYEALWHADPFAAPDPEARRGRVLRGDVTPPPPGRIPARFATAVLRGLAADPARRYPTMQALLDDLARDPGSERRRWLWLVVVALTGAGLATALNRAFLHAPEPGTHPAETQAGAPAQATDAGADAVARTPAAAASGAVTEPTGAPDPRRFQLGIGVEWASQWGTLPRSSWYAVDTASLDRIARAGATATNLRFDWSDIEPVQGHRDWSYADHEVVEIEKRGLEPFAYTGSAPAWAGRDPAARCTEPFRNPPANTQAGTAAFREFFRALANRYCGRVKYYAFWDEPNGCSWMSCGCGDQTPEQEDLYAFWMELWYQSMREGCHDVVLAVGGLDCRWGSDPDRPALGCGGFFERLSSKLAGDFFDAVALHPGGYTGDLEVALRDHKVLNWEAIRQVSAALQRRGNVDRMLWIDGWDVSTPDDSLQARLVGAALTGLRGVAGVFEARYQAIADPPGAMRSLGLASLVGRPADARLEPRPAWFAFRDHALGPDTTWHGPVNPGMEFQGQPPSEQFKNPMPFWGPNGAWQFHSLFPRSGSEVLGRKAGFYSAGLAERVAQTLSDPYEPRRRYCFRSAAQGGRDNVGVVPYQIGYIDLRGRWVVLNTRAIAVDAQWRETEGVCHDAQDAGPEIGHPIAIGFGSGADGGSSDIWFDDLQVTSTGLR